jgi:hypothetical protein
MSDGDMIYEISFNNGSPWHEWLRGFSPRENCTGQRPQLVSEVSANFCGQRGVA